MTQLKSLLELRNKIKDKKPDFIRQDYQRRKRLGKKLKWKKPKGIHSKIRHKFKGRRKMPSPGYKSPSKVRGLHSSGLEIVNVSSPNDLQKIRKGTEGIVVSGRVGTKKRFVILSKAKELGIEVLNFNLDQQINKIQEFIDSKKKRTAEEKKEKPKELKETKKEIAQEKEKEQITDEHKKEAEKKEKDRVLTKRT